MSVMPIVRSLRRNLFLALLLVSTLMLSGQVMGQKFSRINTVGEFGSGNGQFSTPTGTAFLSNGDILVTDYNNARICRMSPSGAVLGYFGNGAGEPGLSGGATFIAVDADDNIYVTNYSGNRVQKYDGNGVYVESWSSAGRLQRPRGIAVASNGTVFVACELSGSVEKYTTTGTYLGSIGSTGTTLPSHLVCPVGLALTNNGDIIVTDYVTKKIKRFSSDGMVRWVVDAEASVVPHSVACSWDGDVFVTYTDVPYPDYITGPHSSGIQRYSATGTYLDTFAATGTDAVDSPTGIAIDPAGKVVVAEETTHRISFFKRTAGRVVLWGRLTDGILKPPADLVDVVQFDLGGQHVIALRANGTVVCWGNNDRGQCNVPSQLTDVVQVAAGLNSSLVLKRDGTIVGWGGGYSSNYSAPSPVVTTGRRISGGNWDLAVIQADGTSVNWLEHAQMWRTSDPVVQISGGSWHMLGLRSDRTVYGWELNAGFSPQLIENIDTYTDVRQVVAGYQYSAFLFGDGSVSMRGYFDRDGTNSYLPTYIPQGLSGVRQLSSDAGFSHIIGQLNDGSLVAWGVNEFGECDIPSLTKVLDFNTSVHYSGALVQDGPDTTSPTSTISTPSGNSWATSDITAMITGTDNWNGSGVKEIHYAINQGTEKIVTGSSASFTLIENGTHSIAYWAVDNAGNIEATNYATVKIDKVAPVTTLTRSGGQITLSATDAHSGVSKTKVQVNGGAVADYTGAFPDSVHTVTYWSEDVAGNVEVAKTEIINPGVQSISASQVRLPGGFGVVGTVTLDKAAPVGGTLINLASSISGVVVVDTTVTVPEGATTATFDIDANPVANDTVVSVTASKYETSQSLLLTIQAPTPSSLSYLSTTLSGGTSTTATISISGPAPVGGTVVSLASSSLSALVPTSVTIPVGQMTATFTVSTNLVANDTSAVISAVVYGVKVKSTLSILGPKVISVTAASASIASGATTTGTVTLSTNAPVGGKVVTLTSSNTGVATVPVSVTVPAGFRTATFTITAGTVAVNTAVTITAGTNGSTGTASVTVTLPAAALSTLTTNVTAATGGVNVTGTVTLTRAAPTGGAVVTLASSSTTIGTVPASVTVAAGATTATFTITTRTVTAASSLTITGTYLGVSKAVAITVNPVRLVSTLTLNPTSVRGGVNSTGTVTLTGAATEAVIVTLTSGTTTVARVPATVTVPAGATTATFAITTLTQTATRTSVITARTGTTSRTATLSVTR